MPITRAPTLGLNVFTLCTLPANTHITHPFTTPTHTTHSHTTHSHQHNTYEIEDNVTLRLYGKKEVIAIYRRRKLLGLYPLL